jgi:hypothetical protein
MFTLSPTQTKAGLEFKPASLPPSAMIALEGHRRRQDELPRIHLALLRFRA